MKWVKLDKPTETSDLPQEALKAGVVLEFLNGKQKLIGDINTSFGQCGCCGLVDNLVKRYAIVMVKSRDKWNLH